MDKWTALQGHLRCPLCRGGLRQRENSMRCPKGHTFDVSAKGYINFIPGQKPLKGYDAAFYAARRRVFDAGYYSHVLEGIAGYLQGVKAPRLMLDAGCGEGYYAARLQRCLSAPCIGLDVSREAVRKAASPQSPVGYLVADIANMPIKGGSVSLLMNLFTPANYGEFARVLAKNGLIIKAVPGEEHFVQLRRAAGDSLRGEAYDEKRVADYFEKHAVLIDRFRLTKTYPLPESIRADALRMSPIAFGMTDEALAGFRVEEITIDASVLVGRMPPAGRTGRPRSS